MKHNLKHVLHLTTARDFTTRAVRAWRKLLPDWTPTLDMLRELDTRPHEHITAVRIVATGWDANDPRWDVLMALLEWERRDSAEGARLQAWEDSLQPLPVQEPWDDDFYNEWDEDPPAEEPSDEPENVTVDERRERVVIPFKVVTRMGQVLTSGETTVETPMKASFLDNLTLVKPLREKNTDA